MEFFNCLPLTGARNLIAERLCKHAVDCQTVQLDDALGRVVAEDVIAVEDLPPFSRSTVDGFAVRSIDTFGASEAIPALLAIVDEVIIGEQIKTFLHPGHSVSIPTGGMLPGGADAVIMLEYTDQPDQNTLLVTQPVVPGENVVSRGEDIRNGGIIIAAGEKIAPQHIGALAACGHITVPVRKKIKVAVISSGDELVDIDVVPSDGRIRDINSYALSAFLADMGCLVQRLGIVKDSYQDLFAMLSKAVATSSLVVISGGSSVGTRDYTVRAVESLGTPGILFHGLAVKPGKPTLFGMIESVPVFGLPGHPVAALTVCEQLVKPAIRILSGQRPTAIPFTIDACLGKKQIYASAPGRDDFVKCKAP